MSLVSRLLARRPRAPQAVRTPATRPSSFVPRVEALEAREVPATLLVSGLEGSFGSTVGPDGILYVTEQIAGRISRIDPHTGQVTTVASGLPTGPYAGFGGGAMDVAFLGDTAYVLVAAVGPFYGGSDSEVVGIYRVDGPSSYTVVADLGAWSVANPPPPDFEVFDPNGAQYAMQPYRDGFLVTDGHHNRVLSVTPDGQITPLLQFGNVVPTGLEVRGNTAYLAQAGPVPHHPETGKVLSFKPGSTAAPALVASGAPLLVDVEFGPANTLYALAQGHWSGPFEGYPADPNTGSLVRVNADGTVTVLETGLDRPTSLEFIGSTAYVVGLGGEVVTIDVTRRPAGDTFSAAFGPAIGGERGAVPGAYAVHPQGVVDSFTGGAGSTVAQVVRSAEPDVARGKGAALAEEDVPFRVVVGPGSTRLTLQWRELPTFALEVTGGTPGDR